VEFGAFAISFVVHPKVAALKKTERDHDEEQKKEGE
jgi:hypothetical protein